MKPDLYTKAVLTVIAFLLAVMAGNQYTNPTAKVQAQGGPFAGVQFSGNGSTFTLFDSRTGDVWVYSAKSDGGLMEKEHAKASAPGGSATYSMNVK